KLPDNEKIRILAMSVAGGNPEVMPAQPLYDVLPSLSVEPKDFALYNSGGTISVSQSMSRSTKITVLPRSGFKENVSLSASGLPENVTAKFNPPNTSGTSTLTISASNSAQPATSTVTITGVSGELSHTALLNLSIGKVVAGTIPVDLSSYYNVTGIYDDG